MLTSRRNFLGLLAAPAIVRASSLMKIVPLPEPEFPLWGARNWGDWGYTIEREYVNSLRIEGWKEYMGYVDAPRFLIAYQYAEKIALP